MAGKKKKAKKTKGLGGRLTKAEIKKHGGVKGAWAARRKKGRSHTKTTRKAAKRASSPKKSPKRSSPKRSSPKRKKSRTVTARSTKKRGRKRLKAKVTTRPRKGGGTTFNVRVTGAAESRRSSRRSSKRKKARKNPSGKRKGGRRRSYHRRGAMENPMTGVELFVGGITGIVGFLTADAVDRVLATHALTDKGTKDANGIELYADNPATTGSYAGLFNATAICAPMDAKRWIVGLLVAGVPITIAHFISAPTGRAALQFFGVAAGFRIVGKGLIDLVAMVTKANPIGQRLYDGEMRAAALASGGSSNPELSSLPSAGLGKPQLGAHHQTGCGCAKCKPAQVPTGAGYPSMPREVAPAATGTPATQLQPPAVIVPPPPPPPGPPPVVQQGAAGVNGVGTPTRRFGQWGAPDNAQP